MIIKKETYLKVSDNSGSKIVKCIGMYKGKKSAKIGDVILVSVQKCNPATNMKGKTYKALIIRTRYPFNRSKTGLSIRFNDNAVVLLDRQSSKLCGNRIFGSTVREIKLNFPEVTNLISKIY